MKLDKYTQKSQEAILQAQEIARDLSHQSIEPAHLLLALLRQDEGVVPALVTKVTGSVQRLRSELQAELDQHPSMVLGDRARPGAHDRRRLERGRTLRKGDAG